MTNQANASSSVGQQLKKRRQQLKLSLSQVEQETKIRGKYLVKLETGDYDDLPNDVYVKGFVGQYAAFLGLDAEVLVAQYLGERGGRLDEQPTKLRQTAPQRRLILTPRLLIALGMTLAAVAVTGYLWWQFTALASAPKVTLTSPTADQVINGSTLEVAGQASIGSDVFINDAPVLSDSGGNFSDTLALQDGLNAIKITARNKLGKSTTVTRSILAHLPKVDAAAASVPAAPFDGIAVGITIKGAATGIIVEVDGKEVFHGTMLDGTARTFQGSGRLRLTTTNAGVTNLTITNATVAGKSLSPLGKDGEVKRNLEFAKDTVFQ